MEEKETVQQQHRVSNRAALRTTDGVRMTITFLRFPIITASKISHTDYCAYKSASDP